MEAHEGHWQSLNEGKNRPTDRMTDWLTDWNTRDAAAGFIDSAL